MDCQEGCVVLFFRCESKFNGSIGLVTGREVVSNTQGVPPLSLRDIGNHTPPKSNDCHLKRDHVNRKIVFQPAFSGDMLEYSFTAYCVIFHKLPMYFMYKAICRGKNPIYNWYRGWSWPWCVPTKTRIFVAGVARLWILEPHLQESLRCSNLPQK